ncbi:MAG: hypothetical protein ACE5EA_01760 [Nitrospirota bacterium]
MCENHLKGMIIYSLFIFLFVTACSSSTKTPTSAVLSLTQLEKERYTKVEFKNLRTGGKEYTGYRDKYIKMKTSFVGPSFGVTISGYPADKYIAFMVGTPVSPFFNPMRGSVGHIMAVISSERVKKLFSLELMQNFTLYGKVVEFKTRTPTGEIISETGIEVIDIDVK